MQMKDNEVFPPVVIDHAKGVYLYDTEGKPYLDIISSWWCNLLGHCNPEINEALKRQINTLEHVIFTNFSHKPAIELSRELAELLPRTHKIHLSRQWFLCCRSGDEDGIPVPQPDRPSGKTEIHVPGFLLPR